MDPENRRLEENAFAETSLRVSRVRILLADDHDGWRDQVRLILRTRPHWQIVSDACDGLDAVRKAAELRPDVVLLDVGMPYLNGIEAAIKIRRNSPDSRVVFVTLNYDRDVVSAALEAGARGYVLKTTAATELLPAIEAALRDGQTNRPQRSRKTPTRRPELTGFTHAEEP
jgi:DNA-binding NarL/FixJ family response regulator